MERDAGANVLMTEGYCGTLAHSHVAVVYTNADVAQDAACRWGSHEGGNAAACRCDDSEAACSTSTSY